MTIICGYKDPKTGEVWIGSDSRVVSDGFIWPEVARKIVRCGGWAVAFSGSAMNSRIARERSEQIAACKTPEQIADLLLAEFRARDYKRCEHGGPACYEQDGIVANHEGVWGISGNGCIAAPACFVAVGSGDSFAYGAAQALRIYLPSLSGKNLIEAAIHAAIAFDSGCGGEVVVEQVR